MAEIAKYAESLQRTRGVAFLRTVGNFLSFALRRFFAERLNNSVASLTYSTLLALVPLLVIAFAILSTFRAFDAIKERMREVLFDAVVPEAGDMLGSYLSGFTENASNLTAAGVVALAVTAVMLLSAIEDTLNQVWHVERPRPLIVRFLIFWTVLTLGPMLIGASFALTTDVLTYVNTYDLSTLGVASQVQGAGSTALSKLLGVLISIVGFTALFVLVPARRVRIRHALIGASFAAVAFEILAWGFNTFYTSGSSYQTIYGAVAAVPVFLVWVYTSWMVIILGAVLAAAFPDWWQARHGMLELNLSPSGKLEIALEILARFYGQSQKGGVADEGKVLDAMPFQDRDTILDALEGAGYITAIDEGGMALTRDLHGVTLLQLIRDLGFSAGRDPEKGTLLPDDATAGFLIDRKALHQMLERLHAAEANVVDVSLAEVLSARAQGQRGD